MGPAGFSGLVILYAVMDIRMEEPNSTHGFLCWPFNGMEARTKTSIEMKKGANAYLSFEKWISLFLMRAILAGAVRFSLLVPG